MIKRVGVLIALLFGLLLIAPAASPVRVGHVYSDSMAPTIGTNDGYLIVPVDDIEDGDIVVFWSVQRGEYATHRVVARSSDGFITKGDNNPTTDQVAGHPPVQRSQIIGEVLTIGGQPVVFPSVGLVVPFLQQYRAILLAILLLLAAVMVIQDRRSTAGPSRPGRSVLRVRDIVHPLFVVGIITSLAVTPLGATTYQLTYVATADESAASHTIPIGESVTRNVSIHTTKMPFTRLIIRTEGMTITDRRVNASTILLTLSIPPPEGVGPQPKAIHIHPYPAVLPPQALDRLHDVHPIVAIIAATLTIFLPLYIIYLLLFDGDKPVVPSRRRWFHRLRGN